MSKDAAPPEGEAPKKKGKLMIIIAALVVLIGGGAAAFMMMSKPAAEKKAKHADEEEVAAHDEAAAEDEEEAGGGDEEHPPVYEKLDQFTVNLTDESYFQTDIQLSLASTKVQEKVKAHMPEVRDALIRLLSSKTSEEISQPEGKEALAKEVQKAVNDILGVKKKSKGVKKVLFASFIIQG